MDGELQEDEDEDVLFKNSPLYQHLHDCGFLNDSNVIQSEELQFCNKTNNIHVHVSSPAADIVNQKISKKRHLQYYFKKLKDCLTKPLHSRFFQDYVFSLKGRFIKKFLEKVFDSYCLNEDDICILENTVDRNVSPDNEDISLCPSVLFLMALPCLLSYLTSRYLYPDFPWQYASVTDVTAVVTVSFVGALITRFCILKRKQTHLNKKLKLYDHFLSLCNDNFRIMKKSVRLIQESELIARGFTFVNQKTPVSHLEQSSLQTSQRQCPLLRSMLFLSARQIMLIFKLMTLKLIESHPLTGSHDGVVQYFANIPLEEYGPCVQIDSKDPEKKQELYQITDGFSIASLKGIRHLCDCHVSEFIRRWALTVMETDPFLEQAQCLDTSLNKLLNEVFPHMQQLQCCYESHACVLGCNPTQKPRSYVSTPDSPWKDVYLGVHSLDLHLQSAWNRVRTLSSVLEAHMESNQRGCQDSSVDIESLKTQVKQELLACKACWEESIERVEKLGSIDGISNPETADTNSTTTASDCTPMAGAGKTEPINLMDIDPVIEDQVFEAYIQEEALQEGEDGEDSWISPEERAKKRKERQEAMRMMTELKTVISVRAIQTQEREERALKKALGIPDDHQQGQSAEECSDKENKKDSVFAINTSHFCGCEDSANDETETEVIDKGNNPFYTCDEEGKLGPIKENSCGSDCASDNLLNIPHDAVTTDTVDGDDREIQNQGGKEIVHESRDSDSSEEESDEYEEIEPYKFRKKKKKKLNWEDQGSGDDTVCHRSYNIGSEDFERDKENLISERAKNPLSQLSSGNAMTTDIAKMVAARAQLGGMAETFGDSDDDQCS